MRLTLRIWILGIAVALSIIAIMAGNAATKFLVFVLLMGIMFALSFIKSGKMAVVVVILLVLCSGYLIYNSTESGVSIKYVDKDSELFSEGLRQGEIIKSINGQIIENKMQYAEVINNLVISESGSRFDLTTNKNSYIVFINKTPDLSVEDISKTNVQAGLDLRGGARALVQPDVEITQSQLDDLVSIARNRFNVYGLSDVQIKGVTDLSGNKFMLVEVAGATPGDLKELISQQGEFEAKIGNGTEAKTVFTGGKQDIKGVCKSGKCSGIRSCDPSQEGYSCSFMFALYLNEEAAQRHADITQEIPLDDTGRYLSEKLYLYVDGKEMDSLLIGADLKGQVSTEISIQGPGTGKTQEEAYKDAMANMNKLQTVLITGSLPYKLNIVKLDTISPNLGQEFVYWILVAGVSAIILVGLIVFVRYRRVKATLALLLTAFSEIIIILGVAALIRWNLDLPSIAGILATIGTGVDQQVVILDEARGSKALSIKEKMKRALGIIVTAFFTSFVSLIPLIWVGAGLFKGFALTTMIGIVTGVLITRSAFSDIIEKIEG